MKLIFSISFCCLLPFFSYAQTPFDTTGGRFKNSIFDSVLVTKDVQYSSSRNSAGQMQNLVLDVYQPFTDTESQRPVIVMVHGGSFLQGNKTDLAPTCKHFAQKGYVTVSIQYRLGYSSFTPVGAVQTVIRATQDLKNAIRFLRKSVSTSNPYKIHPNYIFAGGVSAGAITALHSAYMDELSEILPGQNIPTLDSLHNSGQIPGQDWRFKAVINIAGGIGDTNWIHQDDKPVISFHGTADAVVPYNTGTFGGAFALFGSLPIFTRTKNLGMISELRPFIGAGHDYTIDNPSATDTTQNRITRFLYPFLFQNISQNGLEKAVETTRIFQTNDGWIISSAVNLSQVKIFDFQGRLLAANKIYETKFSIPFDQKPRIVQIYLPSGNKKSFVLPPSGL